MPVRKLNLKNVQFDLVRSEDPECLFGWKVCFSSGNVLDASPVEAACGEKLERLQEEIRILKIRISLMKRVRNPKNEMKGERCEVVKTRPLTNRE